MKKLFILIAFLPVLCLSQTAPRLQQAHHTFSLQGDSLTVFQEAEFFSIVPWYAETDTLTLRRNIMYLNVYYKFTNNVGNFPYTSISKDTFSIATLPLGNDTLIVNSYEYGEGYDSTNSSYYTFYTLRDSDTSYFQVLSDKTYLINKSPISLYPNPASDWATVQGLQPEDGQHELIISDLQGKEVKRCSVSNENPKVWVNDLPEGSYMLRLEHQPVVQKLRVE